LLIIVMLLSSLVPVGIRWLSFRDPAISDQETRKLDSLVSVIRQSIDTTAQVTVAPVEAIELIAFDPNHVSKEELMQMGVTREVANRWVKYRERGGVFFDVGDVSKIYGLSEEKFLELRPFVLIEIAEDRPLRSADAQLPPDVHDESRGDQPELSFDLNLVDSSALLEVRGIGPVLSGRVVKFRNSLGGFVELSQLDEVYGIEDYALENLKIAAWISSNFSPKQIDLNHVDRNVLARHPYVTFSQAKVIVAFRDQHGAFNDVDDLYQIQIIDSAWMQVASSYLKVTPVEE